MVQSKVPQFFWEWVGGVALKIARNIRQATGKGVSKHLLNKKICFNYQFACH